MKLATIIAALTLVGALAACGTEIGGVVPIVVQDVCELEMDTVLGETGQPEDRVVSIDPPRGKPFLIEEWFYLLPSGMPKCVIEFRGRSEGECEVVMRDREGEHRGIGQVVKKIRDQHRVTRPVIRLPEPIDPVIPIPVVPVPDQ